MTLRAQSGQDLRVKLGLVRKHNPVGAIGAPGRYEHRLGAESWAPAHGVKGESWRSAEALETVISAMKASTEPLTLIEHAHNRVSTWADLMKVGGSPLEDISRLGGYCKDVLLV